MTRRLTALYTVLCLLATFFTVPAAPTLVCRFTGQPMPPVAANAENRRSCCAVAHTVGTDGGSHYALTSPGCCDLIVTPDREQPPASQTAAFDLSSLVAWAPALPVIPLPISATVAATPPAFVQAPPRAPPRGTLTARGPPSFS